MVEENREERRGLSLAPVWNHVAAFRIPFMRILRSWGYEVHAAAWPAEGRRGELEVGGVQGGDIPFARSDTGLRSLRVREEGTA
jgi:hypothetical protein